MARHPMLFQIVFLTCVPSAFTLTTFRCHNDLCVRGQQYCQDNRQRCYHCKDVFHLCGTDKMPLTCDSYCTRRTMYQREVAYNSTIQELYGRIRNVTNDTDLNRKQLNKWEFDDSVIRWKPIALAVASLFVVSIFLVIVLGVKFCRYRTLLKRKGIEQNNLVEDQTHGIGRDATELKCLINVADNGGNRDSQVSGDSALDSTASYSDSSSSPHNTQSSGGFSVPVPEVGEPRSGDQSNTRLLAANNSNSNNSAFLTTAEQHTFHKGLQMVS